MPDRRRFAEASSFEELPQWPRLIPSQIWAIVFFAKPHHKGRGVAFVDRQKPGLLVYC